MQLTEIGGSIIDPSSVKMFVSVDGAPAVEQTLTSTGGLSFAGTLPAVDCPTPVSFYVQASLTSGAVYRDPPAAPAVEFDLLAAEGVETSYLNSMEQGEDGWTTASVLAPPRASGSWPTPTELCRWRGREPRRLRPAQKTSTAG